jgi:hypothetical protein
MAVATAGTIAALVYYARTRVPGSPTLFGLAVAKLIRARRAYYARQRKPIVREIPGPERVEYRDGKEPPMIVEKEVVRLVDQIFLIPRWGIKWPIHINSLLRRNRSERNSGPEGDNGGDNISNLTPLKQRGA